MIMAEKSRMTTFNMKTLFYVYLIFYLKVVLVYSANTFLHKAVSLSPDFNDRKPCVSPLKQATVATKMECANLCYSLNTCMCFFYSTNNSLCLVYNNAIYLSTFIHYPGMLRYDVIVSDCSDVMRMFGDTDGIYMVQPRDSQASIRVYCESGWLVIQRRINGSVNFYQPWNTYRDGFGDLNFEFWLGNINIHRLTKQGRYELRVDLEDFDGYRKYALYNSFSLSITDSFRLRVGNYSGDAGDGLKCHEDTMFSTYNMGVNATFYHGGWWYGPCVLSNLNGRYLVASHKICNYHKDAIWWRPWKDMRPLKETVMKIRPASQSDINCG